MAPAPSVPGKPLRFYHCPVRGLVCESCEYSVSLPIGKGPGGEVPASLVHDAIESMNDHITKEHWLQNIPGTK